MWWSSEILLAMSIVALGPLMLLIDIWTKACFVRIDHKLFDAHSFLVDIKIV